MELQYSDNELVELLIRGAISNIEQGQQPKAQKVIKAVPTGILKADPGNGELRHQPGSKLYTYTGIDKDGTPILETWGGGVAEVKDDSVILSNKEPLRFPKGHPQEGKVVKGEYSPDGLFRILDTGRTELYNEWVSDIPFVESAYGIKATPQKTFGLKLDPSYAFQIPASVQGDVGIKTPQALIHLKAGDYVVINLKKGKVNQANPVQGVQRDWFAKTYLDFEKHLESLKK